MRKDYVILTESIKLLDKRKAGRFIITGAKIPVMEDNMSKSVDVGSIILSLKD